MSHIYHIHQISSNTIRFCVNCKYFRHNTSGISGTCFLFKDVNLVSSNKTFIDAKIIRQDENLCGSEAFFLNH